MTGKKRFLVLFLYAGFNFIFWTPARAFLAATGITIIASSLLPHILFLLINALLTVVALIKKNRWVFGGFLVILIITATYCVREYTRIRNLNALPGIAAEVERKESDWEQFRRKVQVGNENALWSVDVQQFSNIQRLEVRAFNPQEYTVIIGKTLSEFRLQNTKFDSSGGFFIDLVNMVFDENRLVQYLSEVGIEKSDKILIYCPSGFTSSYIAYILDHYGYTVHYLPLSKSTSLSLDELSFAYGDKNFLIKEVSRDDMDTYPYVYFMLTINDYYEWQDYFCDNEPLPGKTKLIKANKNLENDRGVFCNSNPQKNYLVSSTNLPFYLRNHQFEKNTRVLCSDKWHCFLTKHFLYEHKLYKDFSTLYCMHCDGS